MGYLLFIINQIMFTIKYTLPCKKSEQNKASTENQQDIMAQEAYNKP